MTHPTPPAWVTKRDGRMAPFEADRIRRSLFAVTEELGRPDALLAEDLADGVVHFLAGECEGRTPSTQRIAEVIEQVVRELGQPALAAAFAAHLEQKRLGASQIAARQRHSLSSVYTRDLTAAQDEGLLRLTDLDTPDRLAGHLCSAAYLVDAGALAFDGLDLDPSRRERFAELARALSGRDAVVNLNTVAPPGWVGATTAGPLFASVPLRLEPGTSEALLDALLAEAAEVRIDWHLGEQDFAAEARPRLRRVIGLAQRHRIGFAFDRPRRPVPLGVGLARGHVAVLARIGLHLPNLARQGGLLADVDRFVQRLGTLARLALSAAAQKREHLRRTSPDLARGFILPRARFVVVPVGLDEVVRLYTDWGLANGGDSLELGRRIVSRLLEVLRGEGRLTHLEACLDGPAVFDGSDRAQVPGLTPWDDTASVTAQLRAAGALHALAEHGTLALRRPAEEREDEEAVAGWLEEAWRRSEVLRLSFR